MVYFLVCHQLWQKFGPEFNFLEINTLKFAIIFETNKSKSLSKEIEKLLLLQAKVTVLSKLFFNDIFFSIKWQRFLKQKN